MLKTLAFAFSLTATSALAQVESKVMFLMSDCIDTRINNHFMYNELMEIPFAGGKGVMKREDGEFSEGVWKIYASPDTKNFTIIIEFPQENLSCLVGMGDDLAPFTDQDPT